MYSVSPNNSTTSLSDNDDDEVKDMELSIYPAYPMDVTPAQWTSTTSVQRPNTPQHSPASHLPPEILIHVLRQLHTPRDLRNALLVSRSWCECAVELLWHRPSFSGVSRFRMMLQIISSDDRTFDYAKFVRRLNFIYLGRELTDSLFVRLSRCVKLERLTLVNCVEITDEALQKVLPLCSNLVALDLTNITSCSDKTIIALARAATKLQGINLGGCKNITDEGVLALADHCPLIRRIKLSNVRNITDRSVTAIAKQCPLLLEIDLNGCPKVTDQAIRELWVHSTCLRDFRLSQCTELTDLAFPASPQTATVEVQQNGIQPFPTAANFVPIVINGLSPLYPKHMCEHLRMLDLTSCALVTDEAIAGIIANAPKIRNLVLAKCSQLTDAAVESICKLGKHLHYLHLGHASAITDKCIRTLTRSCTRLRYIDLACCPLLTDLSVFELSGLPKLRRIGLVRVTNLTDQAIFSLADRHGTMERIHLSYCENITVLAIHFLLQRLTKLTHLSLTGIPAFRRQELQKFCRSPPREFNINQRAAFCVYSGKGVNDLRMYLAEIMEQVQPDATVGDNDTDYDGEDDDAQGASSSHANERGAGRTGPADSTETPRIGHLSERSEYWRTTTGGTVVAREEIFEIDSTGAFVARNRRVHTMGGGDDRVMGTFVEGTNQSSSATTPSPPAQQNPPQPSGSSVSRNGHARSRTFGQEVIIEPPSPSPQLSSYHYGSVSHIRSRSRASDGASNRSAQSSGTNNTNGSGTNGVTFYRSYTGRVEAAAGQTSNGGMQTPDLIYAEIGHGRGRNSVAGPGPNTMLWRSESSSSSPHEEVLRRKSAHIAMNEPDSIFQNLNDRRHSFDHEGMRPDASSSMAVFRRTPSLERLSWSSQREHHDPSSPIPYLSSSPTTRELQESVHSALTNSGPSSTVVTEDMLTDSRGRSMRRSLKSTFNAAEHYASALFFNRTRSASSSSSTQELLNGTRMTVNGRGRTDRR